MLNRFSINKVHLALGPTDMRKSIDGLALIVKESFKLDPFSSNLFVFCNRKKDKIKILYWDHNGFWLYYKRLEKGVFKWPNNNSDVMDVSQRELNWLLDGLILSETKGLNPVNQREIL